ncbi:alpha/beta-hydrolase [Corynespora cassiicola Philippines]|uniref:Alpha/beta-hydrolase n=1 Tax=Corynespora cassiicola Philippines TaxID=1448308 RepID=A0A2T2NZ18_CORCC|nr:alpha/beta-hydrolase [Corynespora cassiicola Philippines]
MATRCINQILDAQDIYERKVMKFISQHQENMANAARKFIGSPRYQSSKVGLVRYTRKSNIDRGPRNALNCHMVLNYWGSNQSLHDGAYGRYEYKQLNILSILYFPIQAHFATENDMTNNYKHDFAKTIFADGAMFDLRVKGSGPWLVLLPGAPGDKREFEAVQGTLEKSFSVVTLNMPGMHGYSMPTGRAPDWKDLTAPKVAGQVVSVVEAYGVRWATYFGSGSGGAVALTIAQKYPHRVRNVIVHEITTKKEDFYYSLRTSDDKKIIDTVAAAIEPQLAGMGKASKEHIRPFYVNWVKGYASTFPQTLSLGKEDLKDKPIFWSAGKDTPRVDIEDMQKAAEDAGFKLETLPGKLFPHVAADTNAFVDYIVKKAAMHSNKPPLSMFDPYQVSNWERELEMLKSRASYYKEDDTSEHAVNARKAYEDLKERGPPYTR